MTARRTAATPAKKAAPRKPSAPAAETSQPPPPDAPVAVEPSVPTPTPSAGQYAPATEALEVRLGNRVVFLQDIMKHTYQMSFVGGQLNLTAASPDALVPDSTAPESVDPDDDTETVEVNPDVNLQIHTGDR